MCFAHIREHGLRSALLTGSMLPTTLREMSPCDVAESVIGRPQHTSAWTVKQSAELRSALDPPMFLPERHEVLL